MLDLVPRLQARVAELEALVAELRSRLGLFAEAGETTEGGW